MAGSIIFVGATAAGVVPLPDPSVFSVSLQDIDASTTTRSADGTMLRDRVCGGATAKRKIELEWPYPSPMVVKQILEAISAEFFYVKYPDPYTGNFRTVEMYAGDRSVPMYNYNLHGHGIRYEKLSFNLIEK